VLSLGHEEKFDEKQDIFCISTPPYNRVEKRVFPEISLRIFVIKSCIYAA
jgi:hypothetical protein